MGESKNGLFLLRFGFLCSVLGTGLHSAVDALRVKGTADDVVTHTGEILYTSASDENNAVLLLSRRVTMQRRRYRST